MLLPRPPAPVTIATLPSRRNWSKEKLIDVSWRPSQRSWLLMRTPSPGTRPSGLCRAFEHRRRNIAQHRVCRSEEHTSELQSLMRISYAVFCLKKKKNCSNCSPKDHVYTHTTCTETEAR